MAVLRRIYMFYAIPELIFVAIPLISILLFVIGILGYVFTKIDMDNHPERNLKNRLTVFKTLMIVFGIIFAVFALVIVGFFILLTQSISFM